MYRVKFTHIGVVLFSFLNFPRRICFYRAIKRYFNNKDNVRESAANGWIEKFDFEFAETP